MRRRYDPVLPALLIACVLGAFLGSCEEPVAPYVNPSVASIDSSYHSFSTVLAGQRVLGTITVTIPPESLTVPIERVQWRIDGTSFLNGPYTSIQIPTKNYANGPHTISAELFGPQKDRGLLGLLPIPAKRFGVTMVVDNRPPTAAVLTTSWTTFPVLRWNRNTDSNFTEYRISISPAPQTLPLTDTTYIARITDRNDTTYTDSSIAAVFGLGRYYTVMTTNGQDKAFSKTVLTSFGEAFPLTMATFDQHIRFGSIRATSELLVPVYGGGMRFISLQDHSTTRTLTGNFIYTLRSAMSTDSSTLVVVDGYRYYGYDPVTLQRKWSRTLPERSDFLNGYKTVVVDARNRVYLPWVYSVVAVADAATGDSLTSINVAFGQYQNTTFAYAPASKMLFVVYTNSVASGTTTLQRFDTDKDVPEKKAEFSYPQWILRSELSAAGDRMYVQREPFGAQTRSSRSIEILETTAFASVGTVELPASAVGGMETFCLGSRHLYLSFTVSVNGVSRGRVERYGLPSMTKEGSWTFRSAPYWMQETPDGRSLIAITLGGGSFYVPLTP